VTSAGTYVKEFVHGDLGRTIPNVSSLLQCQADILQLDVTWLFDDFEGGGERPLLSVGDGHGVGGDVGGGGGRGRDGREKDEILSWVQMNQMPLVKQRF
jgi:hypothetical protein